MKKGVLTLIFIAVSLVVPSYLKSQEKKRDDLVVINAMEEELKRSWEKLRLEDYDPPYFISYQIKDTTYYKIEGKYGAVVSSRGSRERNLFVDVRVGNYEFDNSDKGRSGGASLSISTTSVPIDNDPDAIRTALWQATDYNYKKALSEYLNKKAQNVNKVSEDSPPNNFSREAPNVYLGEEKTLSFNPEEWEKKIRDISAVYKEYKDLIDAGVTAVAQKESVYFINTEGTRAIKDGVLYSIGFEAYIRADDGTILSNSSNNYYHHLEDIPPIDEMKTQVKDMVHKLLELKSAEALSPVNVPAVLEPEAAGIIFHEAVGHRLEGERQIDDKEGQTFKDRFGEKIIPSFLTVIDDPTLESLNGTQLLGHYLFDDQGVASQKVVLIEGGVLKNFLLSRSPVNGFYKSNGHGRASYRKPPMARMGNLIVKSRREYPIHKLKEIFIKEIKRQKKPFGLIIRKMTGGETNTSSYNFQAFKATPTLIYKVDPETGKETLVRNVEIVGTPLVSINKIIATGDNYRVFNGFCGAESGYVPVSTVAPSVLISEIELQRKSKKKEKPPILPPPFFDESGAQALDN